MIFGGGSGLYGMLAFALLAVFVAGLMIGRTPEYVGKKIESYEIKMVSIVILLTPLLVLVGTSVAVLTSAGTAGIVNPGAHGFSEVLYAFSSATTNNGSAFAGLSVNTPLYNVLLGIAMWFGRFGSIVPILGIAGSLAAKKRLAAGTLPTHGPLFVVLLLGTLLLVGALVWARTRARAHRRTSHHDRRPRTAVRSRFDPSLVKPAIVDSFKKLTPRTQLRNSVMFCVYVGSILTTVLWIAALAGQAEAPAEGR